MKKHFPFFLFLLMACFYSVTSLHAQECCDKPECKTKAHELATAIGNAVNFLAPYPANQPVDEDSKKQFIEALKKDKPAEYNAILIAAKNINAWSSAGTQDEQISKSSCLSREYQKLGPDPSDWVQYFLNSFNSSSFRSPEFAKGFNVHFYSGTGVRRPFAHTEGFISVSRLLFSYTFVKGKNDAGGHVRVMIGPALYYSRQKAYLMINPRAEFRINDIGNDLVSIGCYKLIVQGNFQKHIQMVGIGIGAELSKFNVEFTPDYDFKSHSMLLQISLGYTFLFLNKDKTK